MLLKKPIFVFLFLLNFLQPIFNRSRYFRRKRHFQRGWSSNKRNSVKQEIQPQYQNEINQSNQFRGFLDQENKDFFDIENQKQQKKAICKGKRNTINSQNFLVIDTEVSECNWYMQGIMIYCDMGLIQNLHILLQNLSNGMIITEPDINTNQEGLNQIFYFPTYTRLKTIHALQTYYAGNYFFYGLKFKFENYSTQVLKCKNGKIDKIKTSLIQSFGNNQSIAGVSYTKRGGNIQKLNFHINTLVPFKGHFNNQNYLQIVENYQLIHETSKDHIENTKIYGREKGEQFTDKNLNDSWILTKLLLTTNGYFISSIQTFFRQKYFGVEVNNEKHLCQNSLNKKGFKQEVIVIPKNKEVSQIDFQMNRGNLCGFVFKFSNKKKTKSFCKQSDSIKSFKFGQNQVFLGFHGFKDDRQIQGLGVLERYEAKDFIKNWGVNQQFYLMDFFYRKSQQANTKKRNVNRKKNYQSFNLNGLKNSNLKDSNQESEKMPLTKKLRLFQIKLIFAHRMHKLLKSIKIHGINKKFQKPKEIEQNFQHNFFKQNAKIFSKKKKKENIYFLFYPNSNYVIAWNILNLLFLIYIVTLMPYFIAFNIYNSFLDVWEKIIDAYFIIDIFVNFNCAFYDDELLIQNRKKIALKYLSSYFLLDLITAIPISWFLNSNQGGQSVNKILRVMKIPKLFSSLKKLKFFKFDFFLKTFNIDNIWKYKMKSREGPLKSLQLAIITYLVLHLGACIFAYIGQLQDLTPSTWIYSENLNDKSDAEIYISAIYYCFVVLTTVGYGDITSFNTYERIFTIIWMIFGIAFYSFTISFITFFFTSRDNERSLYQKKLEEFRLFCRKQNLSKELKQKIVRNLKFSSSHIAYRWLKDDFQVFKDLPLELKYDAYKQIHSELFECPIFNNKDKNFVVQAINLLKPVSLKKGQFLWKINDQVNYMVFVTKGEFFQLTENIYLRKFTEYMANSRYKDFSDLQKQNSVEKFNLLRNTLNQKYFVCKVYVQGSYFGDEEIYLKKNRDFSIQAATDCEFFILSKIDFEKNLKIKFPLFYSKIQKWTVQKINNNNQVKVKVLTFIRDMVQKFNEKKIQSMNFGSLEYIDIIQKKEQNQRIMSLKEIYLNSHQDNPVENYFRNLNIDENYEIFEMNQEEAQKLKQVQTPGLKKMYQEWKVLLMEKNQINLQEKNKDLKKTQNNLHSVEQFIENKYQYEQMNEKFNKIQQQIHQSKILLSKFDDRLKQMYDNEIKD